MRLHIEEAKKYIDEDQLISEKQKAAKIFHHILRDEEDQESKGWVRVKDAALQLEEIKNKAEEVRKDADVFIIVGVGGSNQAARAMIEALKSKSKTPQILYAGNTLSAHYVKDILKQLEGKSVYINVIAKNFETLEPGSHFRILRNYMKKRYTKEEMAKRIILTGTQGSRLEEIAKENNYMFLQFPERIGGRYSAFSPVGLFPIAVAGLDIDLFLEGLSDMEKKLGEEQEENTAIEYAVIRNLLYQKGYDIEMLTAFEPQFTYFTKWWIQLFGESEGKELKGIFPAAAIYSEDLHSMGQYMQDGRRNLLETFLCVNSVSEKVAIDTDRDFKDGFDYLEDKDLDQINKIAEKATWDAHLLGGVPCIKIEIDKINEKTFGILFYFFMMACAVSGKLLGVNPFDQDGVEAYKHSMFKALGKY